MRCKQIVPKWSKDEKEFMVSVHYNKEKGTVVRIPKPILEKMDNPPKVKFVVSGESVKVVPVSEIEQAREAMKNKRRVK
jgi:hypothetical protein